ncbi:MAG: hypothetical protein JWO22_2136 [Frankiales bacterium]|nr:hypothetical protein [Frankiales bacterium]
MKAVVGGTVTQVRDWSFTKDGQPVPMLEVFFFSGQSVDSVAVTPSMGRPEVGETALYVADVKLRSFTRKDNSTGSALSAWADHPFAYECDPFARADDATLKAVN